MYIRQMRSGSQLLRQLLRATLVLVLVPAQASILLAGEYEEVSAGLRADWQAAQDIAMEYKELSHWERGRPARFSVVSYRRQGEVRKLVRRSVALPSLDRATIASLVRDEAWWRRTAARLHARPEVDTYDGIRHRKYRPRSGGYECIIKAEPFLALLIPRIWKGVLLHGQDPLWTIVKGKHPFVVSRGDRRTAVFRHGKTSFALGWRKNELRHDVYLRSAWPFNRLVDVVKEEGGVPEVPPTDGLHGVTSILDRRGEDGLPVLVRSDYPPAGLVEWYRLDSAVPLTRFSLEGIPPEIENERILVVDEVTLEAYTLEGGHRRDARPLDPGDRQEDLGSSGEGKAGSSSDGPGAGLLLMAGAFAVLAGVLLRWRVRGQRS